jgi:hypothetical protein
MSRHVRGKCTNTARTAYVHMCLPCAMQWLIVFPLFFLCRPDSQVRFCRWVKRHG